VSVGDSLSVCCCLCRIQFLRHLRDFFDITFKIKPDPETKTVYLSCLGTGFKNLSKKVT
jgi:RNA 3'-terminal phosphate cyclase-like protein